LRGTTERLVEDALAEPRTGVRFEKFSDGSDDMQEYRLQRFGANILNLVDKPWFEPYVRDEYSDRAEIFRFVPKSNDRVEARYFAHVATKRCVLMHTIVQRDTATDFIQISRLHTGRPPAVRYAIRAAVTEIVWGCIAQHSLESFTGDLEQLPQVTATDMLTSVQMMQPIEDLIFTYPSQMTSE
jgi:hypothetical protein